MVTSTQSGRVEIPLKMACQAGNRRVMAVSKLITVAGERHSLEKAKTTEVYNQAPSRVGTARPDACELTFRIAPIGKAKENVQTPRGDRLLDERRDQEGPLRSAASRSARRSARRLRFRV